MAGEGRWVGGAEVACPRVVLARIPLLTSATHVSEQGFQLKRRLDSLSTYMCGEIGFLQRGVLALLVRTCEPPEYTGSELSMRASLGREYSPSPFIVGLHMPGQVSFAVEDLFACGALNGDPRALN
jgi:hypothetical protein